MEAISILVSVVALVISALTAWLTLLRKGNIKMTQPTMIAFVHEAPRDDQEKYAPKVYLRTLLYSTAPHGHVLENMYIRLRRDETAQNFSLWVYDTERGVVRGSGLFVGNQGIALNHHFLPPDDTEYFFVAGDYFIEVYVNVVGHKKAKLLHTVRLSLKLGDASKLSNDMRAGVWFDWGPDSQKYHSKVLLAPVKRQ